MSESAPDISAHVRLCQKASQRRGQPAGQVPINANTPQYFPLLKNKRCQAPPYAGSLFRCCCVSIRRLSVIWTPYPGLIAPSCRAIDFELPRYPRPGFFFPTSISFSRFDGEKKLRYGFCSPRYYLSKFLILGFSEPRILRLTRKCVRLLSKSPFLNPKEVLNQNPQQLLRSNPSPLSHVVRFFPQRRQPRSGKEDLWQDDGFKKVRSLRNQTAACSACSTPMRSARMG
jgi:hypothetical protein